VAIFDGVRVLDLTTGIAGPYATMFLADHGADVVKVEAPGGDPYRAEPGFQLFNRGKRSVILELETDEGQAHFEGLVRSADAVVVDLPHIEAKRRGLDDARLRAWRPDLVILAIPPYGDRGPLVEHRATPALLAAVDGMASGQASYSGDPVHLVLPLAAYGTAPLAAAGLVAALHARERWGVGQRIEVSQLAGALALQVGGVLSSVVPPRPGGPSPMGSKGGIPTYRLFECGDGRWFFLGCLTPAFFNKMLIAIDRVDLATHPLLEYAPLGVTTDEARAVIVPVLEELFRTQSRDHWIEVFRDADVPAQPVQNRETYFDSSLVEENSMRVSVEHPELGTIEMMGVPLVLEAAPGAVRRHAPLLGEHTAEVLAEPPALPSTREATAEVGPHLLSGVRMLDLTAFIAGPVAPRHLAMLGAEVLKVESPTGDQFRQMGLGFLGWNQGKRGIALDLRTDAGREVLYRLVRDADVLVENYRPGVTDRLKIDYETLRAINPRLIYVSATGYGDDASMREAPGFDPLLQALSGAMHQQGGADEPVFYTVALNDVMTPLLAAFGTCAALYHRERMGEGQRIRLALARSAMAIQAAEYTRFEGSRPFETGGRDFAGPGATQRWFRCADGLDLVLDAASDEERAALAEVLGVDLDVDALTAAFAAQPRAYWLDVFEATGVPAEAVTPRGEALVSEWALANDLVVTQAHPDYGTTTNIGMLVHASRTPGRIERGAPGLSEHAEEVLAELGYSSDERAALAAAGAVLIGVPTPPSIGGTF